MTVFPIFNISQIFHEYSWTKAAIMTKTTGLCHYGETYIPDAFREAGLEITDLEEVEGSLTDSSAETFLQYMQERARSEYGTVFTITKNLLCCH